MRIEFLFLLTPIFGTAQTTIVSSGEYSIQLAPDDLIAFKSGQRVLSVRDTFRPGFEEYSRNLPKDMYPCSYEHGVDAISLDGPFLGIRDSLYTYCKGAAHPSVDQHYATLDLAHGGTQIAINTVFPEPAVLAALIQDSVLKRYLRRRPAKLSGLSSALPAGGVPAGKSGCLFVLGDDFTKSFVMHHSTPEGIAVRLSLEPAVEPCRGVSAELGLMLPLSPKLGGNFVVSTPARAISKKIVFNLQ